jgi:hypothetical protein
MLRDLTPPTTLPVTALSASSVELFVRCPEKWRRRYIDHSYEPTSYHAVLGKSVHDAECQSDFEQIATGERLDTERVQDEFSDSFDLGQEQVEDWEQTSPGQIKDKGVAAIEAYDRDVAPYLDPVEGEREVRIHLDGVEWTYMGYVDVENADGTVVDRKVTGGSGYSQAQADGDLSATGYLLARRAEGNPAESFAFHSLRHGLVVPKAETVTTTRTDLQMTAFESRLYRVASEIAWRVQTGNWDYAAPGTWWCSEKWCGYFHDCLGGGLR